MSDYIEKIKDFNQDIDKTKPHCFFFTGLNIPHLQYEPIYNKLKTTYNVTILNINNDILDNIENRLYQLVDYIRSLEISTIFFVAHSFSSILTYHIALQIPHIRCKTVLLDPSTKLSIPSIERNRNIESIHKEIIVNLIIQNDILKYNAQNMEILLITFINYQKLIANIKTINKLTYSNLYNLKRFIDFFGKTGSMEQERLTNFKDSYDNENTHYILLPLTEKDNLKKIFPHHIHLHRSDEINKWIQQFFVTQKGGKTRKRKYKSHKTKHKSRKTKHKSRKRKHKSHKRKHKSHKSHK